MRQTILEVEVDTEKDGHLWFPPLGSAIRGRLDFQRLALRDPNAILLTTQFPRGVPGQRLRVNIDTGECAVVEPLRDEGWAECRSELEKRSLPIPPAIEVAVGAKVPDWLWEIKRSLDNGYIKIVAGELPSDLGEETVRPASVDPSDAKIDRLCNLVERLLERLAPAAV